MCDSIKQSDEKFTYAADLMKKQGCYNENLELQICLDKSGKNWSKCQKETISLQKCSSGINKITVSPNIGIIVTKNKKGKYLTGLAFLNERLEDYESSKLIISSYCKKNDRILNLGCGNSVLCEDMYDDGYHDIHNIDISEIVVQQMIARNTEREKMKFLTMDALDLKFENESFDFIIDKSTIDAILCSEYSFVKTAVMLKEVQRTLKTNGYYLIISYGRPESRLIHLYRKHLNFEVKVFMMSENNTSPGILINSIESFKHENSIFDGINSNVSVHFAYLCKKLEGADESCAIHWKSVEESLIEEEETERREFNGIQSDKNTN